MTQTITHDQALAELGRRALPSKSKARKAQARNTPEHVFHATGDQLRAVITAGELAQVKNQAKKVVAAKTSPKSAPIVDPLKADAKKAWDAAFAAAGDGDRVRSARKAYGLVMRGTPLADVVDAIA